MHGGVRYLEKAVFNADLGQLKLVYEALHERAALLRSAPHLTSALPILTPCYAWWEVPFYWSGLKAYDLLAGSQALAPSRYVGPAESSRRLPALAARRGGDGRRLKGSVLYYDGQFDDARLNVALAMTAAAAGAAACNYVEVVGLIKDEGGRVVGARVRDRAPPGARRPPAAPVYPAAGGAAAGGAPGAAAALGSWLGSWFGGRAAAASSNSGGNSGGGAGTVVAPPPARPAAAAVPVAPAPAANGRDVFDVYARAVINATGPFSDGVRRLSAATPRAVGGATSAGLQQPPPRSRGGARQAARQVAAAAAAEASDASASVRDVILTSAGAHVTLPEWYASGGPALLAGQAEGGGGLLSSLFSGGAGGEGGGGGSNRLASSSAPHAAGGSGFPATGLIIPKTRDGRVLFMLPWQGSVIAGTTDDPCAVSARPRATAADVDFILSSLADYLDVRVRREDVASAWSGIRPLAADPTAQARGGSQNVSRDHVVFDEGDGVVTVAGGKWTTYRRMAEEAVDAAVAGMAEQGRGAWPGPCATRGLRLLGARGDSPAAARAAAAVAAADGAAAAGAGILPVAPPPSGGDARRWPSGGAPTVAEVAQASAALLGPLPGRGGGGSGGGASSSSSSPAASALQLLAAAATRELGSGAVIAPVARHLASSYGDRAFDVLAAAAESGLGARPLVPGLPILEAEVLHAARQEGCATAADFLARRSRLAFVDAAAAAAAAPRVAELLASELGWSGARRRAEVEAARAFVEDQFVAAPAPAGAAGGAAVGVAAAAAAAAAAPAAAV